jgi:PhnB protein
MMLNSHVSQSAGLGEREQRVRLNKRSSLLSMVGKKQPGGNAMQVQPYLNFDGRCEEAIEFYRAALSAEVTMLTRFSDYPGPADPRMVAPKDKVMHARIRIGETEVMASDGRCGGQPKFQGVSLSLTVSHDSEAQRLFAALADGGQVQMPLAKTFFSTQFGMLADRFGVSWMIYVKP